MILNPFYLKFELVRRSIKKYETVCDRISAEAGPSGEAKPYSAPDHTFLIENSSSCQLSDPYSASESYFEFRID